MKVKIEKGVIQLDVGELVDAMSPEDKRRVARQLCADTHLIKAILEIVADQGESGYGHYFTDDEDGEWWFDSRTTLELREKLIPLMPVAAQQAVREALYQRDQAMAAERRTSSWAWKMYHAWPDEHWRDRPELPKWEHTPRQPAIPATPEPKEEEGRS